MQVKAIKVGFFEQYREEGDVFEIPDALFSTNWMEKTDEVAEVVEAVGEDVVAKAKGRKRQQTDADVL